MASKTQTPPPDEFDFAGAWRPEPGDILKGSIVQLDMGYSEYGNYPIVTVKPDDGGDDVAVHCFHEALRNKLQELKPDVGDSIGIKYFGEVDSKSGKRKYQKYVAKLIGKTPKDFWNQKRETTDDEDDDVPF